MKRLLLILLLLNFENFFVYAQKIKKVSVTYTYCAPETMSVEEAKRTALERAKIQAIADEFGTQVSQNTSTVVSNNNGESDTQFFSTGGSNVKGEWLETTKAPAYQISYADGMLVVEVAVSGKIKQLGNFQIPLKVQLLRNGFESRNEDDTFRNGDDLFMQFQSPVSGNLLVYLIDYTDGSVFCLLPYSSSQISSVNIQQDKSYIFFSDKHAENDGCDFVDEYTLTCNSSSGIDFNEIVILFSSEELVKSATERLENCLPRQLSLDDFNRWYSKILSTSDKIQVIRKPIKIIKN
ncbi:MAG: hypothetical protein NC212_10365 [Staphylococcus sp.]|nr:hypothetical protein [Staphylococcus sp.]